MKLREADFLLVPGLGDSLGDHWQRRWLSQLPNAQWVVQQEWDAPSRDDWVSTLHRQIMMATRPVVLVGHSLGNHTIAHVASDLTDTKVKGALLVAPPDLDDPRTPGACAPFAPAARAPLPFPSLMIASDTDPYCTPEASADMANAWGSEHHIARDAGHINADAGYGLWPDGLMMLGRLLKRI